jgi:acyl-CoA synthetase (AMP-forming)/AMP-acid ligase II
MANLALGLAEAKEMYPDRAAVRLDGLVLTYEELDERSARVMGLLAARGVAPGDRVGLMLPNVPQFPCSTTGCCAPELAEAQCVVASRIQLLPERSLLYLDVDVLAV